MSDATQWVNLAQVAGTQVLLMYAIKKGSEVASQWILTNSEERLPDIYGAKEIRVSSPIPLTKVIEPPPE